MTDVRFAHLVISVVGYKMAKNADVQSSLVNWERQMLRIDKDHNHQYSKITGGDALSKGD